MRDQRDKTFVLSELFSEKSGIVSQIGSNGTPYEIGIEFSARSTINDLPARIALDPDRFYPNSDSFTTFAFDAEKGEVISETISKSVMKFDFPLIFITLEDRGGNSISKAAKNERSNRLLKNGSETRLSTTMYLMLGKVDLNTEHDPLSNEEFELYIRAGSGSSDPVYSTTGHVFDGGSHQDDTGAYHWYPDVNSPSVYTITNEIALFDLSSTPTGFVAVEDDAEAGDYISTCLCWVQTITHAQEYRHDSGSTYTNVNRDHNVYDQISIDGDDVFTSSMFSNFTASNAPPYVTNFSLNDLGVDLRQDNGIPDAPTSAPTLSGSTSGGHPYLSWTQVSGVVDGYKIYRSLNGGAYSHIGTQNAGLYYIDTTRDVATGAYTLYKVKAYNAGGDGPFSSPVFYYTVPH